MPNLPNMSNAIRSTRVGVLAATILVATPALLASAALGQAGGAAPAAQAEPAPLTIGDPAPAFDISDWMKGDPITGFEPGKVTVMEFWATWCGPCRVAFPHISELQERYKDYGVRVIGISDEKVETVRDFLAKEEWQQKMRYTVATDPDRSTHTAYMKAAGQNGIPTAFIVGKTGKVEWIGHPMGMDTPLEQIVKDTWDADAFKKKFDVEVAAERERMKVMRTLREAQQKGDWDAVIGVYDELLAKNPDDLNSAVSRMRVLLTQAKRPQEGYAAARAIAAKHPENAGVLNTIAWTIVDTPGIEPRDLDLALSVAEQANAAAKGKDGSILDTLARCHWEKGDKAKALELQKKAVELAPEGPMAEDLKKTLEKYKGG